MHHRVMAVIGLVASIVLARVEHARAAAPDLTEAPRFVVPGAVEGVDRLSLAESIYDVEVSGVIAHARLEQTYVNEGPATLDAIYVFPMSTRAAITGLTMRIGAREIVARIEEREAAKAAFEAARAQGQTASLLEQERPNVFRMSVANVRPGEVVEVALDWVELLVPTEGFYELVVPAAVAPRYEAAVDVPWTLASEGPAFTDPDSLESPWDITVRVSGGVPLGWVDSPSHPIVAQVDDGEATVGLRDVVARGGRDFVLRWAPDGDEVEAGVLRFDDAQGASWFLALVEPPARVEPAERPAREVVFIVDVSGSMSGFPADTARHLVASVLAELGPRDRFTILTFAGGSDVYAPETVPATPAHERAALAFLASQDGGGGTELVPALDRAFALRASPGVARAFVVITDGFISVEAEAFERVRASLGKASLFTFGVGIGVNRHLVEGLARVGRGAPFIAEDAARASEVAEDFATYLGSPVSTGLALAADGVALADVEPASLPDLYASRPIAVVGKLAAGGRGGRLTLSGRTPAGAWSRTIDLARVPASPRHAAIRTLWARERVARLSDFDAKGANRAEVTRLGLAHGLMTAYTSFVAIDDGRPAAEVGVAAPTAADGGALGGFIGGGMGGGGAMLGVGGSGLGLMSIQGPGSIAGGGGGGAYEAAPVLRLTLGPVTAPHGDPGKIRAAYARRLGAVRHCIARDAGPTPWSGTLELGLDIAPDGTVARVAVAARGLAEAARACVERVFRRVRLPASARPVSAKLGIEVKP
ncbi:MAG: VWA domain-containing protein [Deltaproteobacteria bacterium]|nr:VWA domain-containing protein [Deltaproteobacteria bacterium]